MKRIMLVPVALLSLAACADHTTLTAPQTSAELVDSTTAIAAKDVNAWVYGTFAVTVPGSTPTVITSGLGIVPGNGKTLGSCLNGLWINPQGKPTAGSLTHPNPMCVTTGGSTMTVVLEPISVKWDTAGGSLNEFLQFTNNDSVDVKYVGAGTGKGNPNGVADHTTGEGIIYAYAVDTANTRVGTFTIDLSQYSSTTANLFATDCTVSAGFPAPEQFCLPQIISARYAPLAVGGLGVPTDSVKGMLYWNHASQPTPFYYYGN